MNDTILYPTTDEPDFSLKIFNKKEFNDTKIDKHDIINNQEDIERHADKLCSADFELASHQRFVRNFLSNQTPYNSLLLYHGLGTGKTCSAIGVTEEYREYMKQTDTSKKIIILANENVQNNFKLQLFDDSLLNETNGVWNIRSCIGNNLIQEVNPMNIRGIPKEKITKMINDIIKNYYHFMGYRQFSGYISKKIKPSIDSFKNTTKYEKDSVEYKRGIRQREAIVIKKEFSDRLIIIDEIHNIKVSGNKEDEKTGKNLLKLAKYTDNMKLLLLSATPMFNNVGEIKFILDFMNLNDNKPQIDIKDIFDATGNLKRNEDGDDGIARDILISASRGYISYVKGDNPYTFPYRILPEIFSPENSVLISGTQYPRQQINGKNIAQPLQYIDTFILKINNSGDSGDSGDADSDDADSGDADSDDADSGDNGGQYITPVYRKVIESLKSKYNGKNIPFHDLEVPLQILNMTYPSMVSKFGEGDNIRNLYGSTGLNNIMDIKKIARKRKYSYKKNLLGNNKHGKIFSYDKIQKYSIKIKNICMSVIKSKGIVLIYSQYIDGGAVPIALALEELGFNRYGSNNNLFSDEYSNSIEKRDALTMKIKSETDSKSGFNQAKYALISGDKELSSDNLNEIKISREEDNKYGKNIKVIIITRAASEGVDFKNIRQVHIVDPWYNMSRIEQIIGRAVRTCSHKSLPFIERNVEIYLYATIFENNNGDGNDEQNEESADLYLYRLSEEKAVKMGVVSRILKQNSVDCLLNCNQFDFNSQNFKGLVKQITSTMDKEIDYQIGDKPGTAICDYMDNCMTSDLMSNNNTCLVDTEKYSTNNINMDTYGENFLKINLERLSFKIKDLFKIRYFYKREELLREINRLGNYSLDEINLTLDQLVNDKKEFVSDMFDRLGNIVNVGEYYLFQPIELEDCHITEYERSVPINFKFKSTTENIEDVEYNSSNMSGDNMSGDNNNGDNHISRKIILKIKTDKGDKGDKGNKILNDIIKKFSYCTDISKQSKKDKEYSDYININITINNYRNLFTDDIEVIKYIDKFLIAHLFEELDLQKRIYLINKVQSYENTSNNPNDDNEYNIIELLKEYINSLILTNSNLDFDIILLQNNDSNKIIKDKEPPYSILVNKDMPNHWKEATPSNKNNIKKYIKFSEIYTIDISRLNSHFGFFGIFRKNINVFKITDKESVKKTRHEQIGVNCSQSGHGKIDDKINKLKTNILDKKDNLYKLSNSDIKRIFKQQNLCILEELYLRYYDSINKDGKRWFLSPMELLFSQEKLREKPK